MEFKDKLNKFKRYALTSKTSIYNEDATTAQGLLMLCRKTIAECMEEVNNLTNRLVKIEENLLISYEGDKEELKLTLDNAIDLIKEQVNNSFTNLFNEDAMTNLESAGCLAQAVNECVKTVNMLTDTVDLITKAVTLSYKDENLTIGGDSNE